MAKAQQPANPEKAPRLTARQREVLSQVAKGKSVAPEEGKRIDLTLNSLRKRGLIDTAVAAALGEPARYRTTTEGLRLLKIQSKTEKRTAVRKAPKAVKKAAPRVVTRFVPRVGQRVWNLDGRGRRKPSIYRVEQVGVDDVQLSEWAGHSFKPVAQRQGYSSVVPLSDQEVAAAINIGMPQD
jgi:hypothetical protein